VYVAGHDQHHVRVSTDDFGESHSVTCGQRERIESRYVSDERRVVHS